MKLVLIGGRQQDLKDTSLPSSVTEKITRMATILAPENKGPEEGIDRAITIWNLSSSA